MDGDINHYAFKKMNWSCIGCKSDREYQLECHCSSQKRPLERQTKEGNRKFGAVEG